MHSDDNTPAGQNHQPLDFPPVPAPIEPEEEPRFAALREWWNDAWAPGGVLYERWEEVRTAPEDGWHGMAHWIKVLLAAAGLAVTVLLLSAAGGVLLHDLGTLLAAAPRVQVGTDTSTGVWAVVDQPVRVYIATHSAGLPISASTVYTLWLFTGGACLVLGFITRSNGVRLTWTAWGAASIAMVWSTSPIGGRTVATGIATLAWTLASILALRGLSLRPAVHNYNAAPVFQPEFHPELHLHATIPAPAPPTDDTPDNVHQLQQR